MSHRFLIVQKHHSKKIILGWVIFTIINLRQAIDVAKRVMTKEKCDRKMTDQATVTPSMTVNDGHNRSNNLYSNEQVTFDRHDKLYQWVDNMFNMMPMMATSNLSSPSNEPYKPYICQRRRH